jgi:hypothetical protein
MKTPVKSKVAMMLAISSGPNLNLDIFLDHNLINVEPRPKNKNIA